MNISLAAMAFAAAVAATLSCAAAPPVGGMPTVEEAVLRGCKRAELVIVARVTRLNEESRGGAIWDTAELSLVEMIKGKPSQVPRTYSLPKRNPLLTDQIGDWLEKDMTYLMFLNSHAARGWEGTIMRRLQYEGGTAERPMERSDRGFQSAVKMARTACR